jgi:glycosyltransferase involved in cell wall biosynthesis
VLMPVFSVIIPTHNRLELLVKAVDSVRQESSRGDEIIVVDDGSWDGTCEWLVANKCGGYCSGTRGPAQQGMLVHRLQVASI